MLPWCNTKAMGLHLAEISARVTPGKHCALLVDQAEWHISERLIVPPENFRWVEQVRTSFSKLLIRIGIPELPGSVGHGHFPGQ